MYSDLRDRHSTRSPGPAPPRCPAPASESARTLPGAIPSRGGGRRGGSRRSLGCLLVFRWPADTLSFRGRILCMDFLALNTLSTSPRTSYRYLQAPASASRTEAAHTPPDASHPAPHLPRQLAPAALSLPALRCTSACAR